MATWRWGLAILVSLCVAVPALAVPHSVQDLFRSNVVRGAALSPSGNRVALIHRLDEKTGDVLYIVDNDKPGGPKVARKISLGAPSHLKSLWVRWATDDRLLLGVLITQSGITSARVQALDADGTHMTVLFGGSKRMLAHSLDLSEISGVVPGQPTHIIMSAWSQYTKDLFDVDVMTGEAREIATGRVSTVGWEVKNGKPVLRYDQNGSGTGVSVFGHAGDGNDDWTLLTKYHHEELERPDWSYAGSGAGVGEIYVRLRSPDSDTAGIYSYDVRTKKTGELIAQVPGFDMTGGIEFDGTYVGAKYVRDTVTYVLKDPALQKHMERLDRYFKHQANVQILGIDKSKSHLLLEAEGPRDPGDFYLYDIPESHLELIMSGRPWLEPERLATTETRRVAVRDGTEITTYLTGPPVSAGMRPLVVMPHGGPELRDSISFDPIAQAFAAQGWRVLQLNFRGSNGYGRKFAEDGHHQWSRRMQDDVTDVVRDLIQREIASPGHVVIYGASYGGYAALAGAATTPELYRAAVSVAGVSDLPAFLRFERYREDGDSLLYDHWVNLIGDPKTDGEALRAASPGRLAQQIQIPVLLMHGSADNVVPIDQSKLMKSALDHAHKNVEFETFDGEGHSYWSAENELKQINRSISFFKRVLD